MSYVTILYSNLLYCSTSSTTSSLHPINMPYWFVNLRIFRKYDTALNCCMVERESAVGQQKIIMVPILTYGIYGMLERRECQPIWQYKHICMINDTGQDIH